LLNKLFSEQLIVDYKRLIKEILKDEKKAIKEYKLDIKEEIKKGEEKEFSDKCLHEIIQEVAKLKRVI